MSLGVVLALVQLAWAPVPQGSAHAVRSTALSESRDVMIVEPIGYAANSARYPVVVLLDGDGLLPVASGMMAFLQRSNQLRGAILVGVRSNSATDRYRLFTPPPDSAVRARLANAGGDSAMRRFLESELRAFVAQRWRTSGEWILAGHSLSALFAVSTFARDSSLFTRFIALSPVLGWQNGLVLNAAMRRTGESGGRTERLFLSTADEGERYPPTAVRSLDSLITARKPAWLKSSYRHYAGEDHGSTLVPALYDGLRFVLRD